MALLRPSYSYQCMLQKQQSDGLASNTHAVLSVNELVDSFRYEKRTLRKIP